ncbi:MAG: hypothetical protein IJU51_01570, partial [Clostridia bacterium]|nr:hypothetical protein [Clostridia bacterium]
SRYFFTLLTRLLLREFETSFFENNNQRYICGKRKQDAHILILRLHKPRQTTPSRRLSETTSNATASLKLSEKPVMRHIIHAKNMWNR